MSFTTDAHTKYLAVYNVADPIGLALVCTSLNSLTFLCAKTTLDLILRDLSGV